MKKIIIAICLLAAASAARADKWQIVGPRAMGMGGAGVAAAYGPDAQYWNPALLAQDENAVKTRGVALNAGVNAEATGKTMDALSALNDIADRFQDIQNKIRAGGSATAQETADIFTGLNAVKNLTGGDAGALFQADAGLGVRLRSLAFSVRSFGAAGVTPVVDVQNIGLGLDAAAGAAGLNLTNTAAPADPALAAAADAINNSIAANNLASGLGALLGMPAGSTSNQIANAIVNMADAAGSSPGQILDMANQVSGNLGNLAGVINGFSGAGSYKDNTSQILADGGVFTEFAVGYGYKILPGLKAGGNLKIIQGRMAQAGVLVMGDANDVGQTIRDAFKNDKTSYNFGVDAGALFNFGEFLGGPVMWNPQVGLTARNINNPGFDRPSKPAGADPALRWKEGSYNLSPQLRFGAAATPLNFMTVAADIDLTKNKTLVDGFDSRQLAAGVEINIINRPALNLPLRAGVNKNLAADTALMYTAGAGLNLAHVHIDLTGGASGSTTTIDGTKIPSSVAGALSLSVIF